MALPIAIEYAATRMGPAQRFDISRGSLCQYRGQRGATGRQLSPELLECLGHTASSGRHRDLRIGVILRARMARRHALGCTSRDVCNRVRPWRIYASRT